MRAAGWGESGGGVGWYSTEVNEALPVILIMKTLLPFPTKFWRWSSVPKVEFLPRRHRVLGPSPSKTKTNIVTHVCDLRTQEVETGGSRLLFHT